MESRFTATIANTSFKTDKDVATGEGSAEASKSKKGTAASIPIRQNARASDARHVGKTSANSIVTRGPGKTILEQIRDRRKPQRPSLGAIFEAQRRAWTDPMASKTVLIDGKNKSGRLNLDYSHRKSYPHTIEKSPGTSTYAKREGTTYNVKFGSEKPIQIFYPNNITSDKGFINRLGKGLSYLPPKLREKYGLIRVFDRPGDDTGYPAYTRAERGSLPPDQYRTVLDISPNSYSAGKLGGILAHEAGIAHEELNGTPPKYGEAAKRDRYVPSRYAKQRESNDFGESTALYFQSKGTDKEADYAWNLPNRWNALNKFYDPTLVSNDRDTWYAGRPENPKLLKGKPVGVRPPGLPLGVPLPVIAPTP